MVDEKQERETASEKETGRLEAFSDGVFAVAITLLVFDVIKVPQPHAGQTYQTYVAGELAHDLLVQWPSYMTFVVSFATILIMWVNHHNMFKVIHKSSPLFMFANGFLLLLVTVVPFPTALVSAYLLEPAAGVACLIYSGLFVVICLAYNLLWWSAAYGHRLLKPTMTSAQVKSMSGKYLLGIPGYLLASLLALQFPFVSIGICGLLWIFWAFTSFERQPVQHEMRKEYV